MTSALTGHVKVGGTYPLYIAADTTLVANEYNRVISLQGAGITLTLPSLASCFNGYELCIRNNGTGTLTVAAHAGDVIGAPTAVAPTAGQSVNLLVDHVNNKWQIVCGPTP